MKQVYIWEGNRIMTDYVKVYIQTYVGIVTV